MEALDGLACTGLDKITESLPTLAIPTPDLVEITKVRFLGLLPASLDHAPQEAIAEAVSLPSYWLTCATELVASFALVQAALGAADAALACLPRVGPVTGLRRSARAARRAGRRHMGAASRATR